MPVRGSSKLLRSLVLPRPIGNTVGSKIIFQHTLRQGGWYFQSCTLAPMRKLITEGPFASIRKLESHMMFNVPTELISEVANTIDAVKKIGIRVDWINRATSEII